MVSKKNALGATSACLATIALALGAGVAQAGAGDPTFQACELTSGQFAGLETAQDHGAPIVIELFTKCI
jgi:hypothetical protein